MGQRSVVHDFEEKLKVSNEVIDWLEELYRQIFPNLSFIERYPNNMEKQKQGIDLELFLTNGHVIKIDEKRRDKVWSDILLEYISMDSTNAPGWIEKELNIDYISYIFLPIKTLYFLPWILLKRAWKKYGEEWKNTYKHIPAKNENYTTWSIPVPPDIIWKAIREVSFCRHNKAS